MSKKCIYCLTGIDADSVVDVCTPCGHGVWGKQMFAAIKENMERARDKGDLHQGSVSDGLAPVKETDKIEGNLSS